MLNKKYPDFSVLMSVYKKDNPIYLDKALNSVESQTIIPTEIILVEDGPISDELQKIINKHKLNFINNFKVIKSIQNQGLGASLQLGTKFVSTNWIARMDSDDISVHDRFEHQLKKIIMNPEVAVVGGQITEFSKKPSNIIGYRKVPTSEQKIRDFTKWRSPFNHPTVIINKKVLQKVGGYIPYGNLEDYYLWSRIISKKYSVCNLNKTLVYMRADEGMYNRRGKISNICFFYKLRKYLWRKQMVSFQEFLIGNLLVTLNIILPNKLRKVIYQKYLHKDN